jgi:hypothetical protein
MNFLLGIVHLRKTATADKFEVDGKGKICTGTAKL